MQTQDTDTAESSIEESDDVNTTPPSDLCPECNGQIVQDESHGEKTCNACGLVLDDEIVDRGPEWRTFESDERNKKSRVGAPTSDLMHDKGLSTLIGWQNKDANGEVIAANKRSRLKRLRTWDERFRTKDASERNLKQAFGEINRMASALGLTEPVRETGGVIYKRAVEEELLPGRSIEGMTTASLYVAARQHGVPRPMGAFADVSRVKQIRIERAFRYLSRELSLPIKPEEPTEYIPQFASSLEVSEEAKRVANEILDVAVQNGVHSGKSPDGLAAASLYAATHITNEKLTQEAVSEVSHKCVTTIRTRYQELLEVYAEHEHL
nr:TFIIB-type zinc ribbon-containing protein [Halomicroarcula laminariae]